MKVAVRAQLAQLAYLILPSLVFLCCDLLWRGRRLRLFEEVDLAHYGLSFVGSLLFWVGLTLPLLFLRGWWKRFSEALFILSFTFALSTQAYFFQQYHAYINRDVARYATNFFESIVHQIWADGANVVSFQLPSLALALVFLWGRPPAFSLSSGRQRLSALVGIASVAIGFCLPVQHQRKQASLPDMLYLDAAQVLASNLLGLSPDSGKLRPRARDSAPLPYLGVQAKTRNVVLVILESVRADAVCTAFDGACRRTPFSNELFPERIPLLNTRALSSSTAISMAVLWSGLAPTQSRERLHNAPLLFDYARSAGYQTAYFTSQSILFGNMRLWLQNLGADHMMTGTDVDPECDIDLGVDEELFAARAIEEVVKLKEPFFATIQLSNGHYPYLVRETEPQPFQPSTTSKAPEHNAEFFNHYQNAVHQQDRHLARVLRSIAQSPAGKNTVIVYTSDHGEAFREHDQMGHTFSILDEEVLVPTWIDAPEGTLTTTERRHLEQKRTAFTFHPDLSATILDLMGVWDRPEIKEHQKLIVGTSLLSPEVNTRALPMTNCSPLWSCAFENWGVMQENMKLEARPWDSEYHCWDLRSDPNERVNLGEAACPELRAAAEREFGRLPGKKPGE